MLKNGQVVLTAATALNFGRQASGVSIAADVHSRKLHAPRQETIWEFHASADQSIDPSQHDSEEVFYTSPSSPISSPPAHSPYSTPFHSAASSTATLGFDNPQFISVSTTSLIESSLSTTVTMMPIKNEPGRHKRIPNHCKLTYTDRDWAKDVRWLETSQHNGARGNDITILCRAVSQMQHHALPHLYRALMCLLYDCM